MKLQISENVWDEVPTNSNGEEDWTLSSNGGNYAFGHRDVLMNGNLVGSLQTTSSGFDYCEITGNFTKTETVEIIGTEERVNIDRNIWDEPYIGVDDFLELL